MQSRVVLAVATLLATMAGAAEENLCVSCHRAQELPISLGHTFADWRGSAHGQAGVGCEKCHGGDPSALDATDAHKGVLPATDANSMVSPARLPKTCGTCHRAALEAFGPTVHAKVLEAAGRGPTCSTCHGAMASSLPSPVELDVRCEACHKKPVEAKKALAVLANTKVHLYRARETLAATKAANPAWHAGGLERFHALERSYHEIVHAWHTFDTERVRKDCHDVLTLTKALIEEAKIQARRGAQ